jgi:hypothetical protein
VPPTPRNGLLPWVDDNGANSAAFLGCGNGNGNDGGDGDNDDDNDHHDDDVTAATKLR